MRSHRYSNHKSNPQYSSTSTIVAKVMKTGQIILLYNKFLTSLSYHEPERMYEFPQKPLNNQENYSPYTTVLKTNKNNKF